MKTLSIGVPAVAESFGIEGVAAAMKGELTPLKFIGALLISLTMNTTFAPVFMTLHKITDTHILNNGGSLRALSARFPCGGSSRRSTGRCSGIRIQEDNPVLLDSRPHDHLPARPQYQVLFAALLG